MKRFFAIFLASALCLGLFCPAMAASRDTSLAYDLAVDLRGLGLFQGGSDGDFALDRAPTKTEAVVMLVRLLGKEDEAESANYACPFTDVAAWAKPYVAYAKSAGLVNGVSATRLGTGNASAATYLTFVLRALGYTDGEEADFTWDDPFSLAQNAGILPETVHIVSFQRADVVSVSYAALGANLKGTAGTLGQKLLSEGAFTQEQYQSCYSADALTGSGARTALSAEEIYAKCSPAVFYLETYDSKGTQKAFGSGFFLAADGTAVTNYHVIDGSYSAKVTPFGSDKSYDVLGVYAYSKEQDWAVLKVGGSGFSWLKLASAAPVGGATVYGLGSPLGLTNTITQGIISNPKRDVNGVDFIQTTAGLNKGSSGGPLLNEYGEVVGITTGSFDMVSMNLALSVDYLRNFSKTDSKTLLAIAVNSNAKLAGYAECPGIPDLGAFYGIPLLGKSVSDTGTTYYYSMSALKSVGAWTGDPSETPLYLTVLQEWGLTALSSFYVGQNFFWELASASGATSWIVIVGTTRYGGAPALSVQVLQSNA